MLDLLTIGQLPQDSSVRVQYKRTRRGKVRKLVRPVYFREDIPCGISGCSKCADKDTYSQVPIIDPMKRILVVDPDTAVTQTDFILTDPSVSNCIIPYSSIEAAGRKNRVKADKLRALCATTNMEGDSTKQLRTFYALPNDFLSETFVAFPAVNIANEDRDFDAVLAVSKFYVEHLSVPPETVVLLTSTYARNDQAKASGVSSMTVWEYVDSIQEDFPLAGEKLSAPIQGDSSLEDAVYQPHLDSNDLFEGIREGRFTQGIIRMAMGTCNRGAVGDVEIVGKRDLNRAVDGDLVVIEALTNDSERDSNPTEEEGEDDLPNSATLETATDAMAERILAYPSDTTSPSKGRVVGILKRNWKEYSGTIRVESEDDIHRNDMMFIPADPRIPFIRIRTRNAADLAGKRIVVVIDSWDRTAKSPSGHWVAILGKAGSRDTESAVILREHQVITREFSKDVMACLPPADFRPGPEEIAKRLDLRNIPVCSIDPPGCKDIDDALSCQVLSNGNYRVGVHIADVTHFVHPDSAIDREAAERCTTVYLVEKRTDMLPGLLTADLCSLRCKVDRLCFSVIWEMTADGTIEKTEFHKAIINSRASLTYAAAQEMIDDKSDNSELTQSIRNLNMLAKRIRQARMDRGALELASQEVRFELDSETQDPTEVTVYQTKDTNRLVEEFMVLANQAVATQILSNFPSTSVLRRHPPPKESQLSVLHDLLKKNGFDDFKYETNKELAESLSKVTKSKDPFFNRLVRVMTTRCMNQAQYFCTGDVDPGSFWHYGLAMDLYTHFTSPIRRYADVLVHRLLAASIGIAKLPDNLQTKVAIHNQCDTMNFKHKMAQLAGRASAELHIYLYFKNMGQQVCDTVVTKIRRTKRNQIAMHVLSPRYGVEGVVSIPSGWVFDEGSEMITNVADGTRVSIFDHCMVRIKADDTNYRFRTLFEFVRKSQEDEIQSVIPDKERKNIEKLMFQGRLAPNGPSH
jgi:exosome complex exonuclease DIS3/RRP44